MSSSNRSTQAMWLYHSLAEAISTNKPVVFTNGCFDIIHVGHISLLEHCRRLADQLSGVVVVGLNTDDSVSRLKTTARPIVPYNERYAHLKAFRAVDYVFPIFEDTPYDLISVIRPRIIVKGGDYKAEDVVGSDLAQVEIFPFLDGYSTTSVIERIKNRNV